MRARLLTGLIAGVLALVPSVAVAEDEQASLTVTPGAVQTLETGQLSLEAWDGTDTVGDTTFLMPVTDITFTRTGEVRAIRLAGGLTIAGEPTTVDLTNFRVNLPSQAASVRASSPDTRIRAFDVARLKVSKKKVTGVLLISPGTAAVLNEQFDTYVFSDGLKFARFEYAL
jgi:hypothetical protein